MKNLLLAINQLQLVAMNKNSTFKQLGQARRALEAAIREAIVEAMLLENGALSDQGCINYLAKFDKIFNPQ